MEVLTVEARHNLDSLRHRASCDLLLGWYPRMYCLRGSAPIFAAVRQLVNIFDCKGAPTGQFRYFREQRGSAEFLWGSAAILKWFKYTDRVQPGSRLSHQSLDIFSLYRLLLSPPSDMLSRALLPFIEVQEEQQ